MLKFLKRMARTQDDAAYEGSTQQWLPIRDIRDGIICLKDGRFIKIIEVLPVNFYLKSETEQENIIYYFGSYLKIAPDKLQIRVVTQNADMSEYLNHLKQYSKQEENIACQNMIRDEINFVKRFSDHNAVKKRFFIVFEYMLRNVDREPTWADVIHELENEAYNAEKYLSQCGLEVINLSDDVLMTDLLYGMIHKQSAEIVNPGAVAKDALDLVHTYRGGKQNG